MSIMRSPDGRSVITRRAGLSLAALALAGWLGLGPAELAGAGVSRSLCSSSRPRA